MEIKTTVNGLKYTLIIFFLFFAYFVGVKNIYASIPFVSIALFSFGLSSGIEIEKNKYRNVQYIWTIKRGKWRDFSHYKNIIILRKKGAKQSLGANLAMTTTTRGEINEIYITDETHILRIHLTTKSDFEDAKKFANDISKKLNLPIVNYNPKISEVTKQKIRESKIKNS